MPKKKHRAASSPPPTAEPRKTQDAKPRKLKGRRLNDRVSEALETQLKNQRESSDMRLETMQMQVETLKLQVRLLTERLKDFPKIVKPPKD